MMRKLKTIILAAVGLMMMYSCSTKVYDAGNSVKYGDVTFRLPEGMNDPNALDYEGIYTLRVVIAKEGEQQGNPEIIHNTLFDFSTPEAVYQKELLFKDLETGKYDFLFIANEASMGKKYDDNERLLNALKTRNKIIEIEDPVATYFPCISDDIKKLSDGTANPINRGMGLPMSWKILDEVIGEGTTILDVPMQRAVAKIKLVVSNLTSEAIEIDKILFSDFLSSGLYLFPDRDPDVPSVEEGLTYFGLENENDFNKIVQSGDSAEFVYYMYPTYAGDDKFFLSLKTQAMNEYYGPAPIIGISEVARNTQLNINAQITSQSTVTINFSVSGWTPETADIPDFE